MVTVPKPEITLSLLVEIEATGGKYRALCQALDVVSAGRSIDEALTNINEAVETRLEDWVVSGTLLAQLEQHSVSFVSGHHTNLAAHADIKPGVLAMALNQSVYLS